MHNVARPDATSSALEETGRIPVLFAGELPSSETPDRSRSTARPAGPATPDYDRIQHSQEFRSLRRRFRWFVFPLSVAFFVWYLTYVLLAAYAHDFMSTKVFGQVNVGMLLGLGQFASTALITWLYVRFARRRLDPMVTDIRERAEVDPR
ncbi:DUF485 domain-containing protein [Amycolatopsis sp. NPDC059021]|uniref:DUF485 domain-containing protein n=1 Tax=Amycolatopsis sp. NPDC059021 TaxID=3346704 RepID=UPI00366ACF6C